MNAGAYTVPQGNRAILNAVVSENGIFWRRKFTCDNSQGTYALGVN
jgi:hypothetical protein